MGALRGRFRRGGESDREQGASEQRLSPITRAVLITRAARAAVWVLLLLSPVCAVLAWVGAGSRQPAAAAVAVPAVATGPSRFAEMYVAAWLRAGKGTERSLAAYYPGQVDLEEVSAGGHFATSSAALSAHEVEPGHWEILVAAEVAANRKGQLVADGLRYYSVAVVALGGPEAGGSGPAGASAAWVAERLPASVAPPPSLSAPSLAYSDTAIPAGPLRDSVEGFLNAYLTGGSFGRYLTPGTTLAAFPGAPYVSVTVADLAVGSPLPAGEVATSAAPPDGQRAGALATVTAVDRYGLRQQLQYPLALTARAGRWEITSLSSTWLSARPVGAAPQPTADPDQGVPPGAASGAGPTPAQWDLGTPTTPAAAPTTAQAPAPRAPASQPSASRSSAPPDLGGNSAGPDNP